MVRDDVTITIDSDMVVKLIEYMAEHNFNTFNGAISNLLRLEGENNAKEN